MAAAWGWKVAVRQEVEADLEVEAEVVPLVSGIVQGRT
jgi:hypothetical protein